MRTHNMSDKSTIAAVMYLVAAIVFLLTAVLGETGGGAAFLILGMAFIALSLNAWNSRSGH